MQLSMEELRQAALEYISSAKLADLDELTSSINARHEAARVKAADEANEVVLAAHNATVMHDPPWATPTYG